MPSPPNHLSSSYHRQLIVIIMIIVIIIFIILKDSSQRMQSSPSSFHRINRIISVNHNPLQFAASLSTVATRCKLDIALMRAEVATLAVSLQLARYRLNKALRNDASLRSDVPRLSHTSKKSPMRRLSTSRYKDS